MDLFKELDRYYRKLQKCEVGSKAYTMYQDVINHLEKLIKT